LASALQHITVPKFTANQIALAQLCANELWNGFDYETGKEVEASDEDLMFAFATPTFAIKKNSKTKASITETDIRLLIRMAKLKALFRSTQPTDFQSAIASYKTVVLPTYKASFNNKSKLANKFDYATKATLDWSVTFVNNPSVSLNGNHRVPLVSRILFFATPDLMIFNFSNGLAKKMRLQTRPQAAITHFNKYLSEGLNINISLLKKCEMPQPTYLSQTIWLAANKGDWWKRRVLDLALLLHFNLVFATPRLKTKARQLARLWAVSKKP